jgi:hypothetical protein
MKLEKEVKIGEGISLDKAIKYCYFDCNNHKVESPVTYLIKFLDRIEKNLFFIILFDTEKNRLTYGLEYGEG